MDGELDRDRLRVLVVCTANVCRSPVVERLIARELALAGYHAKIASTGTHGGRLTVHPDTIVAALEVGVDLSDHRSRALSAALTEDDGADLIITMTRAHLREVASLVPSAWRRSFTLKELARRGADVPLTVTDVREWVVRAGSTRRAADMMGASPADDLADPYGRPLAEHRVMVSEVDELVRRIVALMPAVDRQS